MTTTILSPARKPARLAAFTLSEVIIGAGLSSFILAGVLSTFLFLGRSGANVQNYNDMEAQARQALEIFAQDTRQASAINWASNLDTSLTVDGIVIRYYYDNTARTFYRRNTNTGQTRALVTGITQFEFRAYGITGAVLPLSSAGELASASKSTKQLQISLESARSTKTVATASNTVLSARFILRNKRVTT
jgi:type II secretory pathway component PulJ